MDDSVQIWLRPNVVRIDILNEPEAEEDVAPPLGILTVQVWAAAALHDPEQIVRACMPLMSLAVTLTWV